MINQFVLAKSILLSSLFIIVFQIQGASQSCQHQPAAQVLESFQGKLKSQGSFEDQIGLNSVPVNFNFVIKSDSTGYYYQGLQEELILQLNTVFSDSKIHFYPCRQPNLIYNDDVYDFQIQDHMDLLQLGFQHNRLNIFFVDLINNGSLCGYFKENSYHVVVNSYRCLGDFNSLAHEIGHYLGLPHTFGLNSNGTNEFVNGSNCEISGDYICDTPSDPNRSDLVSEDCTFHGLIEDNLGYLDTLRDVNGDPYRPEVKNIMSYYSLPHLCRDQFSTQQAFLMNLQMNEHHNSYYNCPVYHANFNIIKGSFNCDNYLEVYLSTEHSDPDLVFNWDIDDDGQIDYSSSNQITHTYIDTGNYTISLEVYYPEENISIYRTIRNAINFSNTKMETPFTYDFSSGINADFISVQSQGITTWEGFTLSNGEQVGYNTITPNDRDALEFNVALSNMSNPILEFDYAYHNFGPPGDTLVVEIQSCNNETFQIFELGGDQLNTLSELNHPINPEDWGNASLSLLEFNNQDLSINFITKGDSEFNIALFLDNITIREENANTTSQIQSGNLINIYPNPAQTKLFVESKLNIQNYKIIDGTGHLFKSGDYQNIIDLEEIPEGFYFILLYGDNNHYRKRLLKLDQGF